MFKNILRITIAIIFIASGFVKAVDVVGFSFKLEEYFSPAVFNLPFLEMLSLPLAIGVVILELILGFFLLVKFKLKITLISLISLCIFFAFLTFYSAYYNVVTDCGCFGDALKLTPWQSFTKDLILLVALLILFFIEKNKFGLSAQYLKMKIGFSALFLVVMIAVISWGVFHEPIIDFRDYKIGTDLNFEKKQISNNPSTFKTFYTLNNVKSGENIEVDQDVYINNKKYWEPNSPWKIVDGKTESKLVVKGYESEISKFRPESTDGTDLTEKILRAPKAILIFSYKPKEASRNLLIEAENQLSKQTNTLVYGISTESNTFKTIKNATMDGTAIKTIARSNPFILVLNYGRIVNKQSAKDYFKL